MMASTVSAFFGGRISADRPTIKSISIPEAKKRRQPSKHYVYKIVVQWSNGTSTVIYRRYSMFFDFQIKLQELHASLKERNVFHGDSCPALPELPGKILFGRTQVHQVAEKRRVKIEEFCVALVSLPAEISQSALVLGFFNTWPDDTMDSSTQISKEPTSPISIATCTSPTSPTSSSVINHPDEMEHLEQYRVIADYSRKDSHQVNLNTGQIVHVIEKHYTGWWMIVTEEEQGYAPAAHLEAIDKTYDRIEPESNTNEEEYEVMDTYKAENDDEIELFPGDRVTIVSKSMDGWWKIKNSYGAVGYCPATILRKSLTFPQKPQSNAIYESEKDLYQELNIHKPPPRRSTLERNMGARLYKVPRQHSTPISEDPGQHYKVPRNNNSSVSSGSDEPVTITQTIDLNNPPFSPDHYIMGPCFSEENLSSHPIYENTEFDQHTAAAAGGSTVGVSDSKGDNVYQNMDFDEQAKKKSKAKEEEDGEYINPEEFTVRDEVTKVPPHQPVSASSSAKSGSTYVSYKQVTIASMPLSPPSSTSSSSSGSFSKETSQKPSPSHSVKAILTPSKSLGFIDTSNVSAPEEEYIEMDPVYAPVAPDEEPNQQQHQQQKRSTSCDEDTKAALFVQSVGGGGVNVKPSVPSPLRKVPSNKEAVVPTGRVLERTKSLENMLSLDDKKPPSSPLMSKKTPISNSKPKLSEYDHLDVKSESSNSTPGSSPSIMKKPEPAKKHYHKSVISNSPAEIRKANSPPVASPPHRFTDNTPPNFSPSQPTKGPFVPKTYVAIESYDSQAPGCLSFNAGDRCMLVRQSNGGWWYVNIGGTEGWTPGDFWQEDSRVKSVGISQPPSMAPKKPVSSKPRSQTQLEAKPSNNGVHAPSSPLMETRSSSVGNGLDVQRKPPPGKPRGPPRPPNPPKLMNSTPPPPPPPRKESNPPVSNGVGKTNDYTLLEYASVAPVEEHMWFAGSMEREKAEQFLMEHGRQREFLVRERTNKKGYYALSIRYHYSVKHFNIDPQSNGSYSMGVMNFSSIEEVVKHYQLNSLFIHDGQPVALGQPVRRKSRVNH